MQRMYFLVPDEATAARVVRELASLHLGEQDIAVIARDERQLEVPPRPVAAQPAGMEPGAGHGAIVGTAAGPVAGLGAAAIPGAGIVVGGGAVPDTAAGAAFGTWVAALVGSAVPDSEVKRFERAIQRGELLMIITTPPGKLARIQDRVLGHHPEAEFAGSEAAIPNLV